MDTKEMNRLEDEMMKDKFERWYSNNKDKVGEFENELGTPNNKQEEVIATAFKFLYLYAGEKVDELKAYVTFENYESSTRDAAVIIGGFMKISSDFDQKNNESVDAYLHQLELNEAVDRRSFTIKRLLLEYNEKYKLEETLRPKI